MHWLTRRVYYGWIVVAIGCLTMMLVMGVFFSSGVLFAALVDDFGWSRGTTSLPFSAALICYATTAWLAGLLFDRFGPRRLFAVGVVCLGMGLMGCALSQTPWHLCLSWGLLVAQGFNLAGIAPHLALVALWFKRKRGVASGLLLGGASLGALVVIPGAQYLVDLMGWRWAYGLLGVAVMLCLVPLNAWGQQHRPEDLGLNPDGDLAPSDHTATPAVSTGTPGTLWHVMGTAQFWLLFVLVGCIGWLGNITSVHQIAHMVDNGFSSLLAASMVGVMGLIRAVSSVIWGALSDRCGREIIFTLGTVLCTLGLAALAGLYPAASVWLLYGYALGFGLGYGVYGAVYAPSVADLFYGPYLGTILGILELSWGLGGFAGSWLGGYWYDQAGSYHGAFMFSLVISVLGCLAIWMAAPRRVLPTA